MKVRIWGSRGSLPVSLTHRQVRNKIITALKGAQGRDLSDIGKIVDYVDNDLGFDVTGTYGGHTSCVEIEVWDQATTTEHVILDMGSGLRALGNTKMQRYGYAAPQTYHIFMSHLHWDHIMGFPFFTPAYIPGNRIIIYGCHADLEMGLRRQQEPVSFPVTFDQLGAGIEFRTLVPGTPIDINGLVVTPRLQLHAGDSYGYRLEHEGSSMVYTTDSEHKLEDAVQRRGFIDFFRNADLVVFDAMYSLADSISVKADWGHSSNIVGVELCQAAGAQHLCLFHHEPIHDDAQIARTLNETRRYAEITGDTPLRITSAYDGMEIVI